MAEELTRQDLTYAVNALRQTAYSLNSARLTRLSRHHARSPSVPPSRTKALAVKFERIAKQMK